MLTASTATDRMLLGFLYPTKSSLASFDMVSFVAIHFISISSGTVAAYCQDDNKLVLFRSRIDNSNHSILCQSFT
jgi:hypothetical protein